MFLSTTHKTNRTASVPNRERGRAQGRSLLRSVSGLSLAQQRGQENRHRRWERKSRPERTAAGVSQGTHLFLVAGFSGHGGALKHRDHHENIGCHTWKIRKCVRPERRNKQAPPWPWSCALRKLCPLLGHNVAPGALPPLQTFLLAHLQPFP